MLQGEENSPQVNQIKSYPGIAGNLQTIKIMSRAAHAYKGHPKVRQLAKAIIRYYDIPSHFYYNEALAIGQFVQEKFRYIRDCADIEQVHDPLTMIDWLERDIAIADCDDQATLAATLLLSIGHIPYFRAVRYNSFFGPYNHIYTVVYEKNLNQPGFEQPRRLVLDTIIKDQPIGFEVPHKSGKEFRV